MKNSREGKEEDVRRRLASQNSITLDLINFLRACFGGGLFRIERGSGKEYLEQVSLIFENHRNLHGLVSERIELPIL